jgi:hypothetical protein
MRHFIKVVCGVGLATLLVTSYVNANHIKYTYLKIGQGEGSLVSAFTSKQACETERRKFEKRWERMIAQMKKQTRSGGTFAPVPRAKCLTSLPIGFQRPKTGH